MPSDRRRTPRTYLRDAALTLERLAAAGAASGVVEGASEQLQRELPELDGQLRALAPLLAQAVAQLAKSGADGPEALAEELAGRAARGAVREGLLEMRRSMPTIEHARSHLAERLERWLDNRSAESRAWHDAIEKPGDRARAAAAGAAQGALQQLESAAPVIERLVEQAGRKLVQGIASQLEAELTARPGLGETLSSLAVRAASRTTSAVIDSAAEGLGRRIAALREPVALGARKALPLLAGAVALAVGLRLSARH